MPCSGPKSAARHPLHFNFPAWLIWAGNRGGSETGHGISGVLVVTDHDGWPGFGVLSMLLLTEEIGRRNYVQEVRSGSSYISKSDLRLHFGLGASPTVDHIAVRWPNGGQEEFAGSPANRFLSLTEGTGKPIR
jgi:hypothetical protein